jgi:hypothetical protein
VKGDIIHGGIKITSQIVVRWSRTHDLCANYSKGINHF